MTAIPRASACARLFTMFNRVPSTTASTTPKDAADIKTVGAINSSEAKRLIDRFPPIGEQRARHRRDTTCEDDRAANVVPLHPLAADDIDRARQFAAQERVPHADADVDRDVALSFDC